MDEAEEHVLALMAHPREQWQRPFCTNPPERLNKEIRRRANVVGIFPNAEAAIRLVGALLIEQTGGWQVTRRYRSTVSVARVLSPEGAKALIGTKDVA